MIPLKVRKQFIDVFKNESFKSLDQSQTEDKTTIVYSHSSGRIAGFKLTKMATILVTEKDKRKACGINLASEKVIDKYRQLVARHFNIDWRL